MIRFPGIFVISLALLLANPARADDAAPAPLVPESTVAPEIKIAPEITLGTFAIAHPECKAWTNACTLCKRGGDDMTVCSTPGIACTPATDILCTDPTTP